MTPQGWTEETVAEAAGTIVDIAVGNPDFRTLVALLTAAFEALAVNLGVTIEELSTTFTDDVKMLKRLFQPTALFP